MIPLMTRRPFMIATVLAALLAATLSLSLAPALAQAPPAPPAAAAPQPPEAGSPAPDFTLTSNEGRQVALKDFRGKWVVLYFYPKDFTGGCTLEAHNFQRDLDQYEKLGAVIVGVSVDSAESHKSFCAKEGLTFRLLSDPDAKVSTQYGSVMEYNGAKLSARNTFIIDPDGKLAKVITGVKPAGHSEEVLALLAGLRRS